MTTQDSTAMLCARGVSKTYAAKQVLASTTLEFATGRTTVLIGPSGCGKSTLLRILIGLITPDSGSVLIDGTTLTQANVDAVRHAMGYVIQEGGLFPHLSCRDNITLLGRHLQRPAPDLRRRVDELCALTRMQPDMLSNYPDALSGGQRQRVALMRALLLDPPILLLDEPLGALDPMTRASMQRELKEIFDRLKKTVVMVTHDMHEAAFFAGEIVLLKDGHLVQCGTFENLQRHPADTFVTEFIRAQNVPMDLALLALN